jgi:hypothetical protein
MIQGLGGDDGGTRDRKRPRRVRGRPRLRLSELAHRVEVSRTADHPDLLSIPPVPPSDSSGTGGQLP